MNKTSVSVTVGTLDSVTRNAASSRSFLHVTNDDGATIQLATDRTDVPLGAPSGLKLTHEAEALIGRRVGVTATRETLRPGVHVLIATAIEDLGPAVVARDFPNVIVEGTLATAPDELTVRGDDGTVLSLRSFGGSLLAKLARSNGARATVSVTISEPQETETSH